MTDDEFHKILFEANKKLIKNYFAFQSQQYIQTAERLYFQKDASFRGFRQT